MRINILIAESKYEPVLVGEDDYEFEYVGGEIHELTVEFGQDFSEFSKSLIWEDEYATLYWMLMFGYWMNREQTLEADYEDSVTGLRIRYSLSSEDENTWREFDSYIQQWRDYEADRIKKQQQELNERFKGTV